VTPCFQRETACRPHAPSRCVLLGLTVTAALLCGCARQRVEQPPASPQVAIENTLAGSATCRECHEEFYELWSTSRHGKAMQVVTQAILEAEQLPQDDSIRIGDNSYTADLAEGYVVEDGPAVKRTLTMEHALGGKNVYYFLTPLSRGRLQVMPIGFDARAGVWFDTTATMVRHFVDFEDEPLHWTDPLLTFNAACHSCHVSQLQSNYDLETDTYHTTWQEPGISCETCHGPASEHVRVCVEAEDGDPPADLRIISMRLMTPRQRDETCATCHAKMRPLTEAFQPGEPFFDHYDVSAFEDRDFHPDGRDLGENYTYTLWLMNPCARKGKLECLHCHTPSGRYRFSEQESNNACLPCHEERVANASQHTHHTADGEGSRCTACHMPTTIFGRMARSDHSMRPPMPTASRQFASPNACNLCHSDQSVGWVEAFVRQWYSRDYQAATLQAGELVEAARAAEWSRLPEILQYAASESRGDVFAASIIRLLAHCDDPSKGPVLTDALSDPSPLIRASAATALVGQASPAAREPLLEAAEDGRRVVRVAAGAALASYPDSAFGSAGDRQRDRALAEYEASLRCQPDSWTAHYNLGNYHVDRDNPRQALEEFETAARLRPDVAPPLVNAALVHAGLGEMVESEELLRRALTLEPDSAPVHFNLALAVAERGDTSDAEAHLRAALEADPGMAEAAYNLGVLLAEDQLPEALAWCREAAELRPRDPKYGYTYAYYLLQAGEPDAAVAELDRVVDGNTADASIYSMLASLHEERGRIALVLEVYIRAAADTSLSESERAHFRHRAETLGSRER